MIWRRQFSLLSASLLLTACAAGPPDKPGIPESISPGWKLNSLAKSPRPPELGPEGSPECWRAGYTGQGTADLWICWYRVAGNAFDAVQRVRAEAQAVKFQEGRYFVLAKWNNTPKGDLTALIRGVQKALQPPK